MSRPVFLSWLWNARGGWREGTGYTPQIIQGLQHMLAKAAPDARHICISDPEYHAELVERGVEVYPLWETHGRSRTERHGFDCYARLGLWGEPGERMARELDIRTVQWVDCDAMILPTAGPVLLEDWLEVPEMFWMPRAVRELEETRCKFGDNAGTWLGLNGSMVRLELGSRPEWWHRLESQEWIAETERHICGSDQAAMTRLLLEERGLEWREPNRALYEVPRFSDKVVPWGVVGQWEVAFFPYDPFTPTGERTDYTKPWLSANAYLARQYRVLAGFGTEAEQAAECHPGLRRFMGKR